MLKINKPFIKSIFNKFIKTKIEKYLNIKKLKQKIFNKKNK